MSDLKSTDRQRIKLMLLWDLLRQNTDEEHPLSTNQIIYKLEELGVAVERKTLYEDIRILQANGYEIMCARDRANRYYVEDRDFDVPELRILLDSVQSATFITPKKTKDFVSKIASLAGTQRAEVLKQNIVWFDTVKHSNEMIYYNIDSLNKAILEKKTASFMYFHYDTRKQKVYKRDTKYTVSPVALIFTLDNYYLVTYSEKYGSFVNYRVDRMDNVEVGKENVSAKVLEQRDKMPEYKSKIFEMYGGKPKVAEFIAKNSLVDVVVDKFGEKIVMRDIDAEWFTFKANVLASPTFYSWVATFGQDLKLVGDGELIEEYKKFLQDAIDTL